MATVSAPAPARAGRIARRGLDTVLVILGILVVWQCLHWLAGDIAVTAPLATLAHLAEMMGSGPRFWRHVDETATAFGQAMAIALLGGVAIGVVLGGSRLAAVVAEPILVAIYSLPKITLYPVILLIFGLGMQAKVAFGVIHGIIPVAIFTMNAVRNMRPIYMRAARAMRLSWRQRATHVLIPAALPEIVSGLRIGFALTLLGVLIGELFASQRGVGFLLLRAMERNDVPTILALAVFLFTIAAVVSWALLRFERSIHHRPED
jgi:NitT/TauT family transport system permease protein